MKRLVLTTFASALYTTAVLAMPTQAELKKAQPLVAELMSPAMADFKAAGNKDKAAAAVKVADKSVEFANSAETEAAKFLLLKGAVNFYTRGEAYDKAADAVAALQANVKDVTPSVIAEITGKATGKISETKAPRLFAQYRAAKLQVRAETEAKTLAQKLKKVKSDALQRRYAEALAVSGNWKAAYKEFAKLSDAKLKAVVEAEAKGSAKNAESGEFWWTYEPDFEDAEDLFKAHAAAFYRKALDAGEITGLKKNIVEQRIGGIAVAVPPSVGAGEVAKAVDPIEIKTGGGSPFEVKGDAIVLTLENGMKLEFVKCPPGKFMMLTDTVGGVREVEISRPFWIMRSLLSEKRKALTVCPGIPSTNVPTDKMMENFMSCLTEKYKDFLPGGMVFRLPSFSEWEYSYHAGTKEKNSVYYELRGGVSDWGRRYEKEPRNAWGIGHYGVDVQNGVVHPENVPMAEQVYDRLQRDEVLKPGCSKLYDDGNVHYVLQLPHFDSGKDPFFWSDDESAVKLGRLPQRREWFAVQSKHPFRLVIGPDLVSEWKAKKEGNGVAAASPTAQAPTSAQSAGKAWQEKGNAAWLDLGERGKLEFVKCPAGSFKQLIDADMTKIRVEISRDFWIMKRPLTPRECAFVPQMRPSEADGVQILKRVGSDRIAEYLSDAFANDLPKNMVVRLPTAAEWEYAFLANTRDRKSPFYESYPGQNHRKMEFGLESNNLSKPNDWGVVFSKISELLLDVFPLDSVENWDRTKDPDGHSIRALPKAASATDPFTWCENDGVAMIQKRTAGDPWQAYTNPKKTPFSCARLVVGPDLVSEWKAKHGKK